jgi:hypothetical protein
LHKRAAPLAGSDSDEGNVADALAPVVAEPAIAFGDCDRPLTPAPSAAFTR